MRERDTRTDYTFGTREAVAAAQARERRRQRLLGLAVLAIIGGAVAVGYKHLEPQLESFQRLAPLVSPSPEPTRMYRWQDESGHWHVADRHPGENVAYEVLEYRDDVNVLPLPPQLKDQD